MPAYNHDAAWAVTSIASSAIADAATATTLTIDNDGKLVTNVAIEVAYGGVAAEGLVVRILQDVDGSDEDDDSAWAFAMPYAVSATKRKTIQVPGEIAKFKIKLSNDTGAAVTATVKIKQAIV